MLVRLTQWGNHRPVWVNPAHVAVIQSEGDTTLIETCSPHGGVLVVEKDGDVANMVTSRLERLAKLQGGTT